MLLGLVQGELKERALIALKNICKIISTVPCFPWSHFLHSKVVFVLVFSCLANYFSFARRRKLEPKGGKNHIIDYSIRV